MSICPTPGAGALCALRRPAANAEGTQAGVGANFTQVYRQYLHEYQPKELIFECTARNLEYVLEDLARPRGQRGHFIQQLRWTCAVRDYRNGMPANQLRQKLGLSHITWRETLPKVQKLAGPALWGTQD